MTVGKCRACGKSVTFHLPRGWNLRQGLVPIRCEDGEHWVYMNPSDDYEASCQLAAINSEAMRFANEYHIHGRDCGDVISCL